MAQPQEALRAGKIQTVTGLIEPEDVGFTHVHEHIIHDQSAAYYEPLPDFPEVGEEEVNLGNRWLVEHHPFNNRDNLRFTDVDVAVDEVRRFGDAGGGTLVEMSTIGFHSDPAAIRVISERSGVSIVKGTGWYTRQAHTDDLESATVDELAAKIVCDLTEGIDGTDIKAGIIGEVGLSKPIHLDERKSLQASVIAQQETGVAINIHPGMGDETLMEIVDILEKAQAAPDRVIIGHLDCFGFSREAIERVADKGYLLAWDNFGATHFMPTERLAEPLMHSSDGERLRTLRHFADRGNLAQITIGQDMSCKHDLVRYGGSGYSHILRNVVPMMRRIGFTDVEVNAITIGNPTRALTIQH